MRSTVEGFRNAFAAYDKAGRCHRTGDNSQNAATRGRSTFAVHDHLALNAINDVAFPPSKVVMVLDIQNHTSSQLASDMTVNQSMVRRSISSHQVHRRPVFLACSFIESKPSEML